MSSLHQKNEKSYSHEPSLASWVAAGMDLICKNSKHGKSLSLRTKISVK